MRRANLAFLLIALAFGETITGTFPCEDAKIFDSVSLSCIACTSPEVSSDNSQKCECPLNFKVENGVCTSCGAGQTANYDQTSCVGQASVCTGN